MGREKIEAETLACRRCKQIRTQAQADRGSLQCVSLIERVHVLRRRQSHVWTARDSRRATAGKSVEARRVLLWPGFQFPRLGAALFTQ